MVLSSQDRATLREIKLPSMWLCIGYIVVGLAIAGAGLLGDTLTDRLLCLAGGALVAVGVEKWITRRWVNAVVKFLRLRGPLRARVLRGESVHEAGHAQR